MKAKVKIVYDDAAKNREIEVPLKDGLKGTRLMDAIDKGVTKTVGSDPEWKRWSLLEIIDDFLP